MFQSNTIILLPTEQLLGHIQGSWCDPFVGEVAQIVKNLPAILETRVQSLVWEDPLEKEWLPTQIISSADTAAAWHGLASLPVFSVGEARGPVAQGWCNDFAPERPRRGGLSSHLGPTVNSNEAEHSKPLFFGDRPCSLPPYAVALPGFVMASLELCT